LLGSDLIEIHEWIHGLSGVRPLTRFVLRLDQFKTLCREADDLHEEFMNLRNNNITDGLTVHLGSNIFASIKPPYHVVHIRQWSFNHDTKKFNNTSKGVALKYDEWKCLYLKLKIMYDALNLDNFHLCSDNHFNQLDFFTCSVCNPNDFHMHE